MNILGKVSLGKHYFQMGLLLRESMFLNGILTNAEVWYGITKEEIEQLEALDMDLLRQMLNTPFSVPSEGVYLELGCRNIGTILKARRINYLHTLLTQIPRKAGISL